MVTDLQAQLIAPGLFRLTWSSGLASPVYRVYVDGFLVATTASAFYELTVSEGDAPDIEVLDQDSPTPLPAWPGWALIQFYTGAIAADHYRVERYVGSEWVLQARVAHEAHTYRTWRSPTLADDTTHQFRVIPVGGDGNAGTPAPLTVLMVRLPDVPEASFAYDADTGVVTIA